MNLVASWLSALDGVTDKLAAGGRIADVGCGHGAATILLAQAFPNAQVHGFDYHDASIAAARSRAADTGLSNVQFETAPRPTTPDSTTWYACSTACTTWVIRWPRCGTSASPSPRTAR
jgi:trans-aconitate methyltransferase